MADKYSNFKSFTELEAARDEKRKAQQLILEKAKRQFEVGEAKKAKAKREGEGTWMLDSVSHRISKEENDLSKAKKKSKKRKKKKKKREKSSSGSSSDSDQQEWVEADPAKEVTTIVKGPQLQRDSWMEAPLDFLPTTSRQDIGAAINKSKEEARRAVEKAAEPGQNSRELNPHWKDGGTGLPQVNKSSSDSVGVSSSAGDGGYSWLQKAYTRCVQQAKDEGKSLEEVAAQRYGSLKNLEKMLAEAKEKMRFPGDRTAHEKFRPGMSGSNDRNGKLDRRRERSSSRERRREKNGRKERRSRSNSRDRWRQRNRSKERWRNWSVSSDRSSSSEGRGKTERINERRRSRNDSRERNKSRDKRRKRSSSEESSSSREGRGGRNRSKERRREGNRESADRGTSRDRNSKFMRPDMEDRAESSRSSHCNESPSQKKARFMRPGDSGGQSNSREQTRSEGRDNRQRRTPDRGGPRWKKRNDTTAAELAEQKPKLETQQLQETGKSSTEHHGDKKEKLHRQEKKQSSSPVSSSDVSDDSESSATDQEDERPDKTGDETAKILTEEELNDLAAKILRAEIMGDDDLAAELKSKLEAARHQRSVATSGSDFSHRRHFKKQQKSGKEEEEDNVIVLSRTSKSGMVRPVAGSSSEQWGGKSSKKKRKTVSTHDSAGERSLYFEDDNKFDLKTLVEQEKSGTAEDQNAMFSRLAGRSNDRDLDVDDMFVSKAARKQDENRVANRDRMAAIFEHRKISAAMETCSRCFEKCPKHLIVAIGTKSYLCLPPHRSLTEGHCLIVPMQHSSSCTSIDEDVWREMQLFRKSLVQMFVAQDEDVVVMETVMHLKRFPHTAIECIPLEKEVGDLAPIYFKKAIQEAGPEWADNKKLHSLREKDVRHVIPKGFPYFSVDFGLEGGFATVIEDEQTFPSYFGREVVGGMIDAEPALWRKPHKQSFEDQRQKVLKFEKMWREFDWTQTLNS